MSDAPMLKVDGLNAWYGESHILHGVDFHVAEGEVVTLLGRNGAGKTTTLKSIMGLVRRRSGSVTFGGVETVGMRSDMIARRGVALCPEERGIFASLNVTESLLLPPVIAPGGLSVAEIHELFPNLKERATSQGTKLSGGEQQMLAIGRALMANPRLLLLDEPSLGLAPLFVEEIFRIIEDLKREGRTILIVEQNARAALEIADHAYVLQSGHIGIEGPARDVAADPRVVAAYLGG